MSEAAASQYPIRVEVDYTEPADRMTTFFRIFLVIPHLIALMVLGIIAYVMYMVLWFTILITGKRPEGPAKMIAGYIRWSARAMGYMYCLTDESPPFNSD